MHKGKTIPLGGKYLTVAVFARFLVDSVGMI